MHLPNATCEWNDYHAARRENEATVWNPPCSCDGLLIAGHDSPIRDCVPARVAGKMLSEVSLKVVIECNWFRIVRELHMGHYFLEPHVSTP